MLAPSFEQWWCQLHQPPLSPKSVTIAILGNVIKQMKKAKLLEEEIEEFLKEAQSGNYDHLLQTCMKWVTVN